MLQKLLEKFHQGTPLQECHTDLHLIFFLKDFATISGRVSRREHLPEFKNEPSGELHNDLQEFHVILLKESRRHGGNPDGVPVETPEGFSGRIQQGVLGGISDEALGEILEES